VLAAGRRRGQSNFLRPPGTQEPFCFDERNNGLNEAPLSELLVPNKSVPPVLDGVCSCPVTSN